MKALTMWQPWASLVVLGHKRFETRSWAPSERQLAVGEEFAIHAARRPVQAWVRGLRGLWTTIFDLPEFATWVDPSDYRAAVDAVCRSLPYGAVVGVCKYLGAMPITGPPESYVEKVFGDWQPGRFSWGLEVMRSYHDVGGIPAVGHQGIWNWDGEAAA